MQDFVSFTAASMAPQDHLAAFHTTKAELRRRERALQLAEEGGYTGQTLALYEECEDLRAEVYRLSLFLPN